MLVFLLKIFASTFQSDNTIVLYEDNLFQTLAIFSKTAVNYFLKNKLKIKSVCMLLDREHLKEHVYNPHGINSLPYIAYDLKHWRVDINFNRKAVFFTFEKKKFKVDREMVARSLNLSMYFVFYNSLEYYCIGSRIDSGVYKIVFQDLVTRVL